MGNILTLLQEIFMLKEDTQTKIGLSCLKNSSPVEKQRTKSHKTPKELKISDLMRRRTV